MDIMVHGRRLDVGELMTTRKDMGVACQLRNYSQVRYGAGKVTSDRSNPLICSRYDDEGRRRLHVQEIRKVAHTERSKVCKSKICEDHPSCLWPRTQFSASSSSSSSFTNDNTPSTKFSATPANMIHVLALQWIGYLERPQLSSQLHNCAASIACFCFCGLGRTAYKQRNQQQ